MSEKIPFTDCVDLAGSSVKKYDGTRLYVSTGALDCDHIDFSQVEECTYENKPSRANLAADCGTVLFAKMQGTKKTIVLDDKTSDYIYSTGFAAVRARPDIISERCLYHLVTSAYFLRQKDKYCFGATQKAITNKGLEKIMISVPDTALQLGIADRLDLLDTASRLCQRILERLDDIIKSRFVEMFGDPLKPTKSRLLGEIAILERGRFSPRPRNDSRYYNGMYPFVQTGDVANCDHRLSQYHQTLNEEGIKVSKRFEPGTILIALVGATIGATAILEIPMYAPDSLIGITANDDECNNVFLEVLLRFWQAELKRIAPEAARANINLRILQNVPIIDVPVPQQEIFAAFVADIEKSKSAVAKCLQKTEYLKSALMQQYFG